MRRRYSYPGCLMVEAESLKFHAWLRNGAPTLEGLPGEAHYALAVLCLLLRWCHDIDPPNGSLAFTASLDSGRHYGPATKGRGA